jgi:2,4-dienoyl-CoA reductase-like NADH-dependent reductase (Old Yellow Enzyme family)
MSGPDTSSFFGPLPSDRLKLKNHIVMAPMTYDPNFCA